MKCDGKYLGGVANSQIQLEAFQCDCCKFKFAVDYKKLKSNCIPKDRPVNCPCCGARVYLPVPK